MVALIPRPQVLTRRVDTGLSRKRVSRLHVGTEFSVAAAFPQALGLVLAGVVTGKLIGLPAVDLSTLPCRCPHRFTSDHKALELSVPLGVVDCQQGFLSPSVSWEKPQDVLAEDWRQWLDEAWTASEAVQAFDCQVAQGSLEVQEAWDMFMGLLHDMCCQALHRSLQALLLALAPGL